MITAAGQVIIDLGHDLKLVKRLQIVHDNLSPSSWEGAFKRIADETELTYTPPVPASN